MSEYNEKNEGYNEGYNNEYNEYQGDYSDVSAESQPEYRQAEYQQYNTSDQYSSYYNNRNNNSRKTHKRGGAGKFAKLVASGLVFGLVAGVAFQGVNVISNKINPKSSSTYTPTLNTASTIQTSSSDNSASDDVSAVAAAAMPSVVSITSTIEETVNYGWFGGTQTEESEGSGSGIIISEDDTYLYIVTNNHVVEDATKIAVGFCDDKTAEAEIKGTDSDADIAVVTVKLSDIESDTKEAIKIATLGDSDAIKVGEKAIAIGNALGYGQSVTGGYISATNREVALTDKTMTLIQTDAAINPGNSGGALLNSKGEVIGINTVKVSDTTIEGMGYAIPINDVQDIIESLMNSEAIPESEQAYLGITGRDLTESYAEGLGMPSGIYVVSVQDDSPASKAGIVAGDIIQKMDDRELSGMDALKERLSQKKSGEEVTITLERRSAQGEYEEQTITVTLGAKKDMPESTEESTSQSQNDSQSSQGSDSQQYQNPFGQYGQGQ